MATCTMTRIGNSVGIALPKEIRGTFFKAGDKVHVESEGAKIIITPANERPTLESLMRGYNGPKPEFIDPGESVGKEVW